MVLRVDSTGSVYLGAVPFRNRWCCWGCPLAWPLRMILWDDRNSKLLQEQTVEYVEYLEYIEFGQNSEVK